MMDPVTETRTLELHRRGETPAQSAFRTLQAANELGLDGARIVGLVGTYQFGAPTMDVVVRIQGRTLVLNAAGDELVDADRHDAALQLIADDDGMPRPEAA